MTQWYTGLAKNQDSNSYQIPTKSRLKALGRFLGPFQKRHFISVSSLQ